MNSSQLRILSAVFLASGLAACASYTEYPVLQPESPGDESLSCEVLEEKLDEADHLRDQIIKEHGDAISGAVTDTAIQAVGNPVSAAVGGVMRTVGVSGATKHYTEAAAAAGSRMEQMLILKRNNRCETGVTKEWGVSDRDMLERLEALLAEHEAGNISSKAYLKQRAEILSSVRY